MEREALGSAVMRLSTEGTEEVLADFRRVEIGAKTSFQAQAAVANETYNDMAHKAASSIKDQTRGYRELIRSFEQVAWSAAKVVGGIGAIAAAGVALGAWIASLMEAKDLMVEINAEQDKLRQKYGDLSWEEKAILKQHELEKAYGDLIAKAEKLADAKERAAKRAQLIDERDRLSSKSMADAEIAEQKRVDSEREAANNAVLEDTEARSKANQEVAKRQEETDKKAEERNKQELKDLQAVHDYREAEAEFIAKEEEKRVEALKKQNAELQKQSDLLDQIRQKQQELDGVTKRSADFIGGSLDTGEIGRLLRNIDRSVQNAAP